MTEPDTILGGEVAIQCHLDESGISLKAKSRAVSGFDRLIGSVFDLPSSFFEGAASKRRLKDELQRRLLQAQAEVAEKKLRNLPTAGDELLLSILKKETRRQANAGAVALEALENLRALPAPDGEAPPADDQGPERLDDDWLNQLSRYAEDASSENLQQLWGRVLAGEVQRPGSFSRHTLRFVAELDKHTADNCEYAVEHVVAGMILNTSNWHKGRALEVVLDLQQLGLLEGVGSQTLLKDFTINEQGNCAIRVGSWAIVLYGPPQASLKVDALLVTRLGLEVFSLLSPKDEKLALRQLAQALSKQPLTHIELGRAKPLEGNRSDFTSEEVLWKA